LCTFVISAAPTHLKILSFVQDESDCIQTQNASYGRNMIWNSVYMKFAT